MKFFITWERYSEQWVLLEKGYHFLELGNPLLVNVELGDYLERLAEARGVEKRYIVPLCCQPLPSSREENEPWQPSDSETSELDPLFRQAVAFVREKGRASITGLQRHLNIGWARSAQLIEQMESQGIVSLPSHDGKREVL
ncbi:DNA translocase FtsK [Mangrovibacter sp. SLW1]